MYNDTTLFHVSKQPFKVIRNFFHFQSIYYWIAERIISYYLECHYETCSFGKIRFQFNNDNIIGNQNRIVNQN